MSDGVYVSMCGAAARMDQLDSIAERVAHAQTPGFRAAHPAFESFLAAAGASDKVYAAAVATHVDLKPAQAVQTGNPLDVYPEDGAFLTVRGLDGRTAYTRDGRLTLDTERRLNIGGRLVLGVGGGPIALPPGGGAATIDKDGVVRAGGVDVGELARVHLEGQVDRVGPSLVVPMTGDQAVPVRAAISTGALEIASSGALAAAGDLMMAQRGFDFSMQALQTYRQMDQRSTEVGRVR